MSRSRYRVFETEFPYFLTNSVVAWLPVFSQPQLVDIVFESWRFLQKERGVEIFGFVVMENRLHWIARAPNLSVEVGRFKSFTARRIIDELAKHGRNALLDELRYFKLRHKLDQMYQFWQEGSHPQQIQGDSMMHQKLEYMHNNPVRRGYVDEPTHWRYSSARNYDGKTGLIDVITNWL